MVGCRQYQMVTCLTVRGEKETVLKHPFIRSIVSSVKFIGRTSVCSFFRNMRITDFREIPVFFVLRFPYKLQGTGIIQSLICALVARHVVRRDSVIVPHTFHQEIAVAIERIDQRIGDVRIIKGNAGRSTQCPLGTQPMLCSYVNRQDGGIGFGARVCLVSRASSM